MIVPGQCLADIEVQPDGLRREPFVTVLVVAHELARTTYPKQTAFSKEDYSREVI
ncbi:hypothetical protein HO173_002599 [Letharia columbiana]|uniref:Uncharacterized protein n=1 Tax=Letharia columbiana TaxID=112416 RepID=A0A8H6L8D8_9LECA|nr:uncharacterized protein HO173_002599 [Letharia columbiana]KAF6239337.1 hypothetical protein HO173_002599 [Letharia columbiana]